MCKKLAEKLHLMSNIYKNIRGKKGSDLSVSAYVSQSKAMAINHITIFSSRLLI
jgi:hypothetical protein